MSSTVTALDIQKAAIPEYAEQNVSMVQQLAQAQIQSAYIMAERHPRDWDVVEQQVLKECRRPQFCAVDPDPKKYGSSIAMYGVPRGGSFVDGVWTPNIVRDLTIRFAEMALPYIKNASVDLWPMGEDEQQRVFRVVRIDFESNVAEGEIIIVPKTVERSKVKEGDFVTSQRTNSNGKPVYILRATNEEMDQTKLVLYSKRKRNLILSMLPGWLKEAAKEAIRATQRTADAKDPDAARRALYAGFAQIGVSVEEIKAYLGHSNDLSPAELEDLRVLYAGIAGGHTTWKEILAAKDGDAEKEDLMPQIDALFAELKYANRQITKTKGNYLRVGGSEELLKWLQDEVAKKRNDGSKPQQDAEKSPAKEADTKTEVSSTSPSTAMVSADSATKTIEASPSVSTSTKLQEEPKTEQTNPSPAAEPLDLAEWD